MRAVRTPAITPATAIVPVAAAFAAAAAGPTLHPSQDVQMKNLTPVLPVEAIEPVLPFWEDRLGFERTAEVPEGDRLGFVILRKGNVQVMYQTLESIANDVASLADVPVGGTLLFIEVDDLDAVAALLEGIEPVTPRRTTFYGADELILREPGGHIVTFAEMSGGG